MKIAQIGNNSFTFGANCIFDKGVEEIANSPTRNDTDYIRRMFDTYRGKAPVMFTLTDYSDGKGPKITAINLANGQVYPERVKPNKGGLNTLMGYLMQELSYRHDTFWNPSKEISCNIRYDENNDITIEHKYANGYKTLTKKQDGIFKISSIFHKDLPKPLYKDGEIYYPIYLKYYENLPKWLKNICKNAVKV